MKSSTRKTLLLLLILTALVATVALCACDGKVAKLSVTFDDSHTVYVGDSLDDLKPFFSVTYTDKDGATIDVTDFTLGGTLDEGKSIIAVSYNGLSQKVTVTVLKKDDVPQPKEYTVTFKADGESVGTATYTSENKNITEPTVPAKAGYTGAWESYTLTTGDVTVNAIYTAKQYTVTLDYNGATGGNGTATITVTFDRAIGALPSPTKDGSEFTGWELNNETVTSETVWKSDGDATLVAQWLAPTAGLQYELNSDGKSYSVMGIGTATDTSIVIPSVYDNLPVTSIGASAFDRCSFTSVYIPDSVTNVGTGAFRDCTNLTNVIIGNNVQAISTSMFISCTSLVSVKIPDSVTSIGKGAFNSCSSLTSVIIPNSVTSIDEDVFAGCTSLTNIIIPSSVVSIGSDMFGLCNSLESIIVSADNPKYHCAGNCLIETETKTLVAGIKNSVIPTDGSVTSIGDAAFAGMNFREITIPDTVVSIGAAAFAFCTNLTSIIIPNSVTSIGRQAFECCTSLVKVTIPSSVTSIVRRMFADCTSLAQITIPNGVTSIDTEAFSGCSSLQYNEYGNALYLGNDSNPYVALIKAKNRAITSCTIHGNTRLIEGNAFAFCQSLEKVYYSKSKADWQNIGIDNSTSPFNTATLYFYSANEPSLNNSGTDYDGNYWHYVNGVITIWKKQGTSSDFKVPTGGYDGSPVTITFYTSVGLAYERVLQTYLAKFNEMYPNITVEISRLGGYDDIRNQIRTELKNGQAPNIAYCFPDHVALYNKSKSVVQLDNLLSSKIEITRADGSKEMLGLTTAQRYDFIESFYREGASFGDNHMYTLPLLKSTELMYYNKDFFAQHKIELPDHWFASDGKEGTDTSDKTSLEYVLAKIKEIDPLCTPLGYDSEANWFITLCEQFGNPYTSVNGEHFLFDNAENRAIAKTLNRWYQAGYITTSELNNDAYCSTLFTSKSSSDGKKCYLCIASSAGATHNRPSVNVDGLYPFEVGITMIPQANAKAPKSIVQGPSLCIFRKDNPQEVIASYLFVKYLTTCPEFQADYSLLGGYMPVIKSACEIEGYRELIDNADGGTYIAGLAVKVCAEIQDSYFYAPAFYGCDFAREQVGKILTACLIMQGDDIDYQIKKEFERAVAACKMAIDKSGINIDSPNQDSDDGGSSATLRFDMSNKAIGEGDFTDQYGNQRYEQVTWKDNGITVINQRGEAIDGCAIHVSSARFYKNSIIEISYTSKIKAIRLTLDAVRDGYYCNGFDGMIVEGATIKRVGNIVVISFENVKDKFVSAPLVSQIRIVTVEVFASFVPEIEAEKNNTIIELDLKQLRANSSSYEGKKVAFEGIVTYVYDNGAYVENYDAETGIAYGICVYYGFSANIKVQEILCTSGNRVRVVGVPTEFNGSWIVSDVQYLIGTPNDPFNLQLISAGNSACYQNLTASELSENKTIIVYDEEQKKNVEKSFQLCELILDTTVSLDNLTVIHTFTTSNGSQSGAITLTCLDKNGDEIIVRTNVLYKAVDGENRLVLANEFEGKNISVKGLVDYYSLANNYQIKIFNYADIVISD